MTSIGNSGQFVVLNFSDGPIVGSSEGGSLRTIEGSELRLGILLGRELGKKEMDGVILPTTVGDVLGKRLGLRFGSLEIEGTALDETDGFALMVGVSLG